jgi:hypothetical protein
MANIFSRTARGIFVFNKSTLIIWILTLIVYLQNTPWFLWQLPSYVFIFILTILLIILCADRITNSSSRYIRHIPFITLLFFFFVFYSSFSQFRFSSVITLIIYVILFTISKEEKIAVLNLLTKSLAIIVGISLLAWLFHNYIYPFPIYNYIGYGGLKGGGDSGLILKNYILFIEHDDLIINRFYCIFDEPGVLGTLSSFILFANKYNFKNKYNLIIFCGGIFTFSLAFYILTTIGIILRFSKNLKQIFKVLIALPITVLILMSLLRDNYTYQNVIEYRLLNMNDSSIESRTSYELNNYFKDYLHSSDIYFGKGLNFLEENSNLNNGQGYKFFIIEYGLFGIFLVFLMYIKMGEGSRRDTYSLILIFFLSFLQRPHLFTPFQLIIFSVAIANNTNYMINKVKQNI